MQRRSFIGSILGVVGGHSFVARAIEPPKPIDSRLQKAKEYIKVFEADPRILGQYRIFAITTEDERIYMPDVLDVERDMENLGCKFKSKGLVLHRMIDINAFGLISDNKVLVGTFPSYHTIRLVSEDRLFASVEVRMNI